MKATNFVRLVCILCAWCSATGALDVKARGEQPARDDPITVKPPPGKQVAGIEGCLAPPPRSYNVRIQSLSTTGGIVYSRQLVTTADFPCFEFSVTENFTAATHIGDCAEAAAKKGLNSFMWEDGACTAFLAWRPRIRADCKDGGSKVVYVVEKPLTPVTAGALQVSGVIRYALPRVYLDISYQYDYCGFGEVPKGYKLQWNTTEVVMLPEGTMTYSLDRKILCFISGDLSMWSIGEDGDVNSNEVQLTITSAASRWYGLQTGGCVYRYPGGGKYNESLSYCSSTWDLPPMFSEKVDGEAEAFLAAMTALTGFPPTDGFFVGLQKISNQWIWTNGIQQPVSDTGVWAAGYPSDSTTCAMAVVTSGVRKIISTDCTTQYTLLVFCYASNP